MTEPNQGTRKAGFMLQSNGRRKERAIEGPLGQDPTQPTPPAYISGPPRARYVTRGTKITTGTCLADLCSRGVRAVRLMAGSNRADARLVTSAHLREDAEPHTCFRSMIGGIPPGGLHGAEV